MNNQIYNQINSAQAILFDMDGTLFDTEPLHAQALALALQNFGKNFSVEDLHHRYYGKTDTSIFLELFPERFKEEYPKFQKTKNDILTNIFSNLSVEQKNQYTSLGLKKFLQFLRSKGKKLALVSSSEQEIVEATLKTFGVNLFFDLTIGRSGTHLNKPNPSPYFRAMRYFKTTCDATLIFEDSPSGLKSANATGAMVIRSVCFDRGELSEDDLKNIFKNKKLPPTLNQFNSILPENISKSTSFSDLD